MDVFEKMQDHGLIQDFKNQSDTANVLSLSPEETQNSAESLCQEPVTQPLIEINNGPESSDNSTALPINKPIDLANDQILPQDASSNFENIPLNSAKNCLQELGHDDSGISNKKNGKLVQSDDESTSSFSETFTTQQNSFVDHKKPHHDDKFRIPKKPEPGSEKSIIPVTNEQSFQRAIDNSRNENGAENSWVSQSIHINGKNDKEGSIILGNPMQQRMSIEKAPTLSDDSRLVKISLPTGSMNLIQSNTQFLNKSRNFLNFITEKSTNIMEKTLLPQNLANRYNSIMKMTDVTTNEKKHFPESSIVRESPPENVESNSHVSESTEASTIVEMSKNNAAAFSESKDHLTDPKPPKSGQEEEKSLVRESSTESSPNSKFEIDIAESVSTKPKDLFSVPNDCSRSSDNDFSTKCDDGVSKEIPQSKETIDPDAMKENVSALGADTSLLKNPVYLTLVRDYAKVREEKLKLAERVEALEAENSIFKSQNSSELFNVQLEALEKTVERLTVELRAANTNQDELGREYAAANKERESMVMKYAVSEKQLIDTQR